MIKILSKTQRNIRIAQNFPRFKPYFLDIFKKITLTFQAKFR